MTNHKIAVIGLGRFGGELARALVAGEAEVIAIDRNPSLVERIRDEVTLAVCLDSTDETALRAQGVDEVDAVVVGIGEEFESSALTVATLKAIGARRIIARAESDIQARILSKVGADEIASPERESAQRWAHRLAIPRLEQYVELDEAHSMIHVGAPKAFHHRALAGLDLRNRFDVNLVGIKRRVSVKTDGDAPAVPSQRFTVPKSDTTILPDDVLILVGSNEGLGRLPLD
jgi:trk system potassium uptake protein TrkA